MGPCLDTVSAGRERGARPGSPPRGSPGGAVPRERHYQLEAQPLMDLQEWLRPYERFWREHLKALRDVLEEM